MESRPGYGWWRWTTGRGASLQRREGGGGRGVQQSPRVQRSTGGRANRRGDGMSGRGRRGKPTKYVCETGGQHGVRIKGKWSMIEGVDHGGGNFTTGRREGCNDLQEFNGNRRGNGRSGGVKFEGLVGCRRNHWDSVAPSEHEELKQQLIRSVSRTHHRQEHRAPIRSRSSLVNFASPAAPSFSNVSRARNASDFVSSNLPCPFQIPACCSITQAKRYVLLAAYDSACSR